MLQAIIGGFNVVQKFRGTKYWKKVPRSAFNRCQISFNCQVLIPSSTMLGQTTFCLTTFDWMLYIKCMFGKDI